MASSWQQIKLGQLTRITMGQSPKGELCNSIGEGVPLLNGPTEFGSSYPTATQFTTDPKRLSEKGDLLFCVRGSTTGRMNWSNQEYAIGRGLAAFKHYEGEDYKHFLRAVIELKLPELLASATGSTFPNVSKNQLNDLEVFVPALPEQKAIAHILGTLDEKIELNRQMNETLEAMAQVLFKSWFVDFDPVIDNALLAGNDIPDELAERAELRQAQLNSGKANINSKINDLFPSEFEFTEELGWIPQGWGNAILSDVLVRRNEKIKAGKETQELRYVPIDCITSKSLFLSDSKDGEEAKTSLTKFYKKDIIFGAMRPYFHKVCIAPFDGTTRSTAFVLKPKFAFDYSFALMQLYQDSTIAIATSESVGSTIPYAKWDGSMADIPICMPSEELRQLFDSIVRASLYKIADRYFSNETLTKLRDTLLPKLMSGELRISDAEKLAENI